MMRSELESLVIEVDILKQSNFLVIKESLERMGVGIVKPGSKRMFPSCIIVHSQGRYFIGHFKIGFELNGAKALFNDDDFDRAYTTAVLMEQWGLLKIVNVPFEDAKFSMDGLYVVPFKEKSEWIIIHKFQLGKGETQRDRYKKIVEGTTKSN
jgi:hypothetical protein